jgi:dihydroorotase
MVTKTLIINARIVNEGQIKPGSVLIENDIIADIFDKPNPGDLIKDVGHIVDAEDSYLLPGVIDDQVHFREPGLTHKAEIYTESRAAVAGGITSFMEMPNTIPQTTTLENLENKFLLGAQNSMANYSFYMGATNSNLEEIVKVDPQKVCGLKIFMGSSTGNMLVDDHEALEKIFENAKLLITTHCEDESIIRANLQDFRNTYGDNIQPQHHPEIRNHLACLLSSQKAVQLAKKFNSRLHILHLSTAVETALFENNVSLENKRITGEVCVHHLWFTSADYATKQNLIKWNPAIKNLYDRETLWNALLHGSLDVVATDHAPHLLEEKLQPYLTAPSGGPLVQHSLQVMAEAVINRNLPLHLLAKWMSHNPAICYKIKNRGFIRKGYYADLVILNSSEKYTVKPDNILYKCGWSPFDGQTFSTTPTHTFINGRLVYHRGSFDETFRGSALEFSHTR